MVTVTVVIEPLECWVCGVPFGLSRDYRARMRQEGATFYCPNGHRIYYGETELMRLRKEREAMERMRDFWKGQTERRSRELVSAEHWLRSTRRVVTRIKRRIGRGVCPCCNRTFKQLAAHMEAKHPDYSGEG